MVVHSIGENMSSNSLISQGYGEAKEFFGY